MNSAIIIRFAVETDSLLLTRTKAKVGAFP